MSGPTDPQILWDPGAQRFYYPALDVARYGFAFGYGKSASPQTGADFCKYILNYGYANTAGASRLCYRTGVAPAALSNPPSVSVGGSVSCVQVPSGR